jgi:hypothetical protein
VTETRDPKIPLIKSNISTRPEFLNKEKTTLKNPPPKLESIVITAALAE